MNYWSGLKLRIQNRGGASDNRPYTFEGVNRVKTLDSDGRLPFSEREYYALRQLCGAFSMADNHSDELKERVRLIPNGFRDLRLIVSMSEKLITNIMKTIPLKKLKLIQRELKNTVCEVKVNRDVTGRNSEGFCYVPEQAMVRTVERVIDYTCFGCEKCGREAKKCPVRLDIESLYPWDVVVKGDDPCPLSGAILPYRGDVNYEE